MSSNAGSRWLGQPAISTHSCSMDMQDNIFEWHFAIRGPPDSEFEVQHTCSWCVIYAYATCCGRCVCNLQHGSQLSLLLYGCRVESIMGASFCHQSIHSSHRHSSWFRPVAGLRQGSRSVCPCPLTIQNTGSLPGVSEWPWWL